MCRGKHFSNTTFFVLNKKSEAEDSKKEFRIKLLWDGRIRTFEFRDQNPLPYRLATPQLGFFFILINNFIV